MKRICPLAAAGVMLAAASPVQAGESGSVVADWQMNEGPKQNVLHDASGNGVTGTIGRKVVRNRKYLHFKDWPFHAPLDKAKTVRVNNDALNPGDGNFAVTWRFRSTDPTRFQNIVQKGQGSPAGGMFKFRINKINADARWSRIECFWRGSNGGAFTTTPARQDYTDGTWHTVRCARVGDKVTMRVDGKPVATDTDPGTISNDWPLSIGGNVANCETVGDDGRHCNYFHGDIAWMKVSSS